MTRSLGPEQLTGSMLADVLEDIARHVRAADSYDGQVTWTALPHEPDTYEVVAVYRIGNRDGQGGVCIVGDIPNVTDPQETTE